jgi:hypothetical protein
MSIRRSQRANGYSRRSGFAPNRPCRWWKINQRVDAATPRQWAPLSDSVHVKRSCFILGCGRSGTSLTAGLLADAGYFMGEELYPGDEGNPKGYFEDREVNGINEGLLAQVIPGPERTLTDKILGRPKRNPGWFRWLADLAPDQKIPCPAKFADRIKPQVARRPFCFKDPRFCYTLESWRQYAPEAAIICVFRDPAVSAASIVKQVTWTDMGQHSFPVDLERAIGIWRSAYTYALEVHLPAGGDWLFVHYDQLLDGSGCDAIARLLGAPVSRDFADRRLRRTEPAALVPPEAAKVYRRLCELAGFRPD